MKKLILAVFWMLLLTVAVSAQTVELTVNEPQKVELKEGFYNLTATCTNTSTDTSYLYVQSEGCTEASTVIPVSKEGTEVMVRGFAVRRNGKCTIGVAAKDASAVTVTNVKIEQANGPHTFYAGGDITQVSYIESLGGKYYDRDNAQTDPITFLADNGMNMARIRLSNNPGKGRGDGIYYMPEGFQNLEDCLSLAKRASDNGMDIQFTFNYSDYWSNGSRQIIPADWVSQIKQDLGYDIKSADFLNSMTDEQRAEIQEALTQCVYDYTYDVMQKLKAQGSVPKYVSLGNEIRGGMLFPFGNTYDASMNADRFELVFGDDKDENRDIKCPKDWAGLTKFINAGYDAVKAVCPDTQVIIHLDDGSKVDKFTYFLDELAAQGAKYDVIGASYYPAWTGNSAVQCREFCDELAEKYNKDIMIMETGFNWNKTRKDGYGGQLVDADVYKEIYPPTKEGQKGFLAELFNELKKVKDGRCVGVLYWDPCMIHVEDEHGANLAGWAYLEENDKVDANVVENTTLFDFDGKPIPSVDVYAHTRNAVSSSKYIRMIYIDGQLNSCSIYDGFSVAHVQEAAIGSGAELPDVVVSIYEWDGKELKRVD